MLPIQNNLYIYNKYKQRLPSNIPHDFYFFGSNSRGNSVYLKKQHLLIDLGFGKMRYTKEDPTFWYDVKRIGLTHEHIDHIKTNALLNVLENYPFINIYITPRMFEVITSKDFSNRYNKNEKRAEKLQSLVRETYKNRFIFLEDKKPIEEENYTLIPHYVEHESILNVAYEIVTKENTPRRILYTSDLDHIMPKEGKHNLPTDTSKPFDIAFVEANYDANILYNYMQLHPDDAHAKGNLRHIAEQETWAYLQYMLKPNGIFIPLHASTSFGTLLQDLS